jgi:hypothetical protein
MLVMKANEASRMVIRAAMGFLSRKGPALSTPGRNGISRIINGPEGDL